MRLLLSLASVLFVLGCQTLPSSSSLKNKSLKKFSSKADISNYLQKIKVINDYRYTQREKDRCGDDIDCEHKVVVTGSRISASDVSITNNQVEGVDEGDIIKTYGDYLVILRKGTLYSVKITNNKLEKIFDIPAHTPGWQHDVWLDEILVENNIIMVLGYNYDLGVSEFIRFEINELGVISYRDTHLIKSSDYFDSGNYASRLYKHQYTSYLPIPLVEPSYYFKTDVPELKLPKVTKLPTGFKGEYKRLKWRDLISVKDIYKPIQANIYPVLHTFIKCPVDQKQLLCQSVGIVGGPNSEFFVNGDNIYLWNSAWSGEYLYDYKFYIRDTLVEIDQSEYQEASRWFDSKIYKINLQDLTLKAVTVDGQPVNQFSFHYQNNALFVFLENLQGTSLVRIPDSSFSKTGQRFANEISRLPTIKDPVNNRFIKDYLILGSQSYYDDPLNLDSHIVDIHSGEFISVSMEHSSDRIDKFGEDVLVAGITPHNNLGVSILSAKKKRLINQLFLYDRLEGEYRSHSYNFSEIDGVSIAGITSQLKSLAEEERGSFYWDESIASDISFIGKKNNQLDLIGVLSSKSGENQKGCDVSCVDWYGNSRPFFIGKRIFALSGDELIEGTLLNGQVIEVNRLNYGK